MQPFAPQPFLRDQGSNAIPPAADHVADDGLQDDCSHDFNHGTTSDQDLDGMIAELVGPGHKIYHNYHRGLNARKCDSQGHFLLDGAPPPSCVQVSPDDWSPYCNWQEFELAKFLFKHTEMLASQINTLLKIWATSLIELGGNPLFANHTDLYHVIDSMSVGAVKWENFKITYKCKHQDGQNADEQDELIELAGLGGPCQVIHNLLRCTNIKDEMDFIPYQEFNAMNKQRHWEDFMLGDWAWEEADKIISVNPSTTGATLAPIILGSDKTTVSIATGQMDYYPLYLSIRNVCNTTHHVHCDAVVLIGFLAMLKTCRENSNTPAFCKFKKQLFHSSLACILCSLHAAMTVPETVLFSDQYYHCIIYSFTAYIADYEEQVLLSSIMHGWCLKCLAHQVDLDQDAPRHCHEHTELIIKELDLQTLWDKYGIDRTIVPFTSEFPCADIQRMLLLDILHQLIKGGFKDHLVDWVEKYLIHVHGRTVTPFTGLQHFPQGQHFKQWTGDDSKGLMKVYIAAIEGYVPEEIILTFSSFLKFCYLVHRNVITEPTLIAIEDAITSFHSHHGIFHNAGVVLTFSLPQQHAMKHYPYLICQFSVPNGLCSSITKSKHIKATNHNVLNKQDCEGDGEEPTTSFEEDPGDMDDSPMNMRDLAIELNIPQFHNILWHFLQSQLQHEDHDPEDVPLDKLYDGSVNVYNSASSMFYAPSDMSGLHGMCHKHICCSPTWRNEGSHYDCVFVITNPHTKGMLGLDVTRYPCVVICWFDHVGDGPNNTGMWVVHMCNAQDIAIIHIDTIYHAAQLIPVYASQHGIDPASIKPNESYDKSQFYYVNKFADHHVFEIVS
ncbi:hypothetical protein EDC04DRAFT_2871492 [Pisolithus marmoratus]|nr:hypothetical protein EDC04DRAFT_2871492 [Pisolithus marmoratus]